MRRPPELFEYPSENEIRFYVRIQVEHEMYSLFGPKWKHYVNPKDFYALVDHKITRMRLELAVRWFKLSVQHEVWRILNSFLKWVKG